MEPQSVARLLLALPLAVVAFVPASFGRWGSLLHGAGWALALGLALWPPTDPRWQAGRELDLLLLLAVPPLLFAMLLGIAMKPAWLVLFPTCHAWLLVGVFGLRRARLLQAVPRS